MTLNTAIRGMQIAETTISGGHLITTNSPADGQVLTWDIAQDKFKWDNTGSLTVSETPTGSINGSNTSFALANTPLSDSEMVFLNGLLQEEGGGNDYTITVSGVITMAPAPETNDLLVVTYLISQGLGGTSDHGDLSGLTDDDHAQYILVDGTRAFTGNIKANASGTLDIGSSSVPFRDLYLTGASLYMNGSQVLSMSGADLVLNSPSGNIAMTGTIDLSSATMNHDELTGLGDDDHTQYSLVDGTRAFTGTVSINNANELRFYNGGSSEYAGFKAPGELVNNIWALPEADATTANEALVSDSANTLSWATHDELSGFAANEHFTEASIDHGSIAGLGDDDHSQYLLADGTRQAATLTVTGDLVVSGTQFIADTQTVLITDNLLVINNGEVGAGVTLGEAGIEVDRGSEPRYRFMFDETNDYFEVGISGSEQPVATREVSPTSSGVPFWNGSTYSLDTNSAFTYSAGVLAVGSSVELQDAPSSDHAANGVIANMTTDVVVTFGQALHIDSTGGFVLADADAATTAPCTALAIEAGAAGSRDVLLQGFIRDDTWAWTIGGVVYLSTTGGALTQTAPAGTGDQVQVLGVATHADRMWFSPDLTLIEVA